MKMQLTRAPYSLRFAYWRGTQGTRGLGDLVIWFFGWQLAVWMKPYPPQTGLEFKKRTTDIPRV